MENFDVAVIGGGPGGYVAAIRSAQLGKKTALVEKDSTLGGTCLNVGCIPTKALLESSDAYHAASHRFAEHGVQVASVELDLSKLMARKQGIVTDLTGGIAMLMKKNKIKVFQGKGSLEDARTVLVSTEDGEERLHAEAIILATGSTPIELPFLPFDGTHVVSSTEALSFDKPPKSLAVVGAGAVGLELGSVWARLGSEVTVIEIFDRIAPFADKQLSQALLRGLKTQGLDFKLNTKVTGAELPETTGENIRLTLENAKGESETLACEKVLVAVGRRPYLEGLGLENIGLEPDDKGRIPVNDHLCTSVEGIYAIGDVVRGPMLAHKAEEEGIAVAEHLAGKAGHVNYDAIPNVIYTSPELAQVGWTEAEAKENGKTVKVGKFYFKGNGRAKTLGDDGGLVKVVADAETDRVLGVHIVGPHASELIAEATLGLEFSASSEDIARTSHAHPTLSEALKEAAMAVEKRQIHG